MGTTIFSGLTNQKLTGENTSNASKSGYISVPCNGSIYSQKKPAITCWLFNHSAPKGLFDNLFFHNRDTIFVSICSNIDNIETRFERCKY